MYTENKIQSQYLAIADICLFSLAFGLDMFSLYYITVCLFSMTVDIILRHKLDKIISI